MTGLQPVNELHFGVGAQIGLGAEDDGETKNAQTQQSQTTVRDEEEPLSHIHGEDAQALQDDL